MCPKNQNPVDITKWSEKLTGFSPVKLNGGLLMRKIPLRFKKYGGY